MYNVDLVLAILEEFMAQRHGGGDEELQDDDDEEEVTMDGENHRHLVSSVSGDSDLALARLIDGYLAEIAKDPSLPLPKFIAIAETAPLAARPTHDALYRAIDMYLKEHPGLSKSEKKRLCALMDCKKLSAEASAHAVQNERLPLRVVVQVLFFEQLRQSSAAAAELPSSALRSLLPRESGNSYGSSRSAATTATTAEDDQWGTGAGDAGSFRSAGGGAMATNKSGGGGDGGSSKNGGKAGKGMMPRKMLSKLWSGKASSGGEHSGGSDTSESPGSAAHLDAMAAGDAKSTHSRSTRHSVS